MNKALFKLTLILLCTFSASSASATSPVWKITKDGETMYIGGTFHMLVPGDYPLPEAFEEAYDASEAIVFETDIAALQTPQAQQRMMSALSYKEGRSLVDDISPETLETLKEYVAERNIPIESVLRFKTGMVVTIITISELQRLGLMGIGADAYYALKAKDDRKAIDQFESVDEQIEFIANMGKGNEDQLIEYTLQDMEQLPGIFSEMKTAWRAGDMEALKEMFIVPMRSDFPAMYELIISDRNNDWMPDIESMMTTPEIEFVLVGALHLAGDIGLLEQLRRKGYTVSRQ